MQMIWKNCGISLGKIVVNTILFDIHKNYTVMNNSRVYAVISIFQRSLFCSLRSRWWRQSRESGVAKMVTLRSRIVAKALDFYIIARGRVI